MPREFHYRLLKEEYRVYSDRNATMRGA